MKQIANFFIGLIMTVIGTALFLSNITVSAGGNGFLGDFLTSLFGGGTSSAKGATGLLIVLVCITLLIVFIRPNIITISSFILSCLIFVFAIVGGMSISMADMSGLDIAIILGLAMAGLGIMIRSLTTVPKNAFDDFELDI